MVDPKADRYAFKKTLKHLIVYGNPCTSITNSLNFLIQMATMFPNLEILNYKNGRSRSETLWERMEYSGAVVF